MRSSCCRTQPQTPSPGKGPWRSQGGICFLLLALQAANAFVIPSRSSSLGGTSTASSIRQSFLISMRHEQNRRCVNGRDTFLSSHQQEEEAFATASTTSTYLATCIPGLAPILAQELLDLQCDTVETVSPAAVTFTATLSTALTVLVHCRTAHKLLEQLSSTMMSADHGLLYDRNDLYEWIQESVSAKDLLGNGRGGLLSLSVRATLNRAHALPADLTHSHYTALTVKNALVDAVRDARGDRPSVNVETPDVPLVVILGGHDGGSASAKLYRQLHLGSLHKRGYRSDAAIHKAALKESLAAGLLLRAGWHRACQQSLPTQPAVLMNPMAGSGTLVTEAALMAVDLAPGLVRLKCGLPGQRQPPVVLWKRAGMDLAQVQQLYQDVLVQATRSAQAGLQAWRSHPESVQLYANELHPGALDLLEDALEQAGLTELVSEIHCGHVAEWEPVHMDDNDKSDNPTPWIIVANPPWSIRLEENWEEAWQELGTFLRQTAPAGSKAWVLSGNAGGTKHLGMRKSSSLSLQTGEQQLKWLEYEIHRAHGRAQDPADRDTHNARAQTPQEQRPPRSSRSDPEREAPWEPRSSSIPRNPRHEAPRQAAPRAPKRRQDDTPQRPQRSAPRGAPRKEAAPAMQRVFRGGQQPPPLDQPPRDTREPPRRRERSTSPRPAPRSGPKVNEWLI